MSSGVKSNLSVFLGVVAANLCSFAPTFATADLGNPNQREVAVDLDNPETPSAAKEEEVDLDELEEAPVKTAKGEEAVDLDDLGGDGDEGSGTPESYLPVSTDDIEPKTNPLFMLSVLGVLLPLTAMLFPPRRKKRSVPKTQDTSAD